MKKPEPEFIYPTDFKQLYELADEETRKKLAYIGYIKTLTVFKQLLSAFNKPKEDHHGEEK